jgi:NADH-quinone oxidoreductase subunit N
MTDADLAAVAPPLILAASAVLAGLLSGVRVGMRVLGWLGAAASAGAAAAAVVIGPSGVGATAFGGTMARDGASVFFAALVGIVAAGSLVIAASAPRSARRSDEVALVLFSASGAALAVAAADLLVLFVGIALLTVPAYALAAGSHAHHEDDGAFRQVLLGAASSSVALYGIALLYAATGETAYVGLGRATHNPLYLAGLALTLAGLAFHVLIAPAHRSAIVVNVATVAALLRLVAATRSGEVALDWEVSFATLAGLAVTVAALGAIAERRMKWLVGYATVAQLGFVAAAVAGSSTPAAAFALSVYAAQAVGLFAVRTMLRHEEPALEDLGGLARQRPLLVFALGILVLGLIGIPPTAGFMAKLYAFEVAVRAQLLWLVVLGSFATVAIAASYVRIVLACFGPPRLDAIAPPRGRISTAMALVAALAIVVAGIVPGPLLEAVQAVRF